MTADGDLSGELAGKLTRGRSASWAADFAEGVLPIFEDAVLSGLDA